MSTGDVILRARGISARLFVWPAIEYAGILSALSTAQSSATRRGGAVKSHADPGS